MLAHGQIEKLVNSRAYNRLIRAVLGAGRCRDPRLIATLTRDESVSVAAFALALQRVSELSYGRSHLGERLASSLMQEMSCRGERGWLEQHLAAAALAYEALRSFCNVPGVASQACSERCAQVADDLRDVIDDIVRSVGPRELEPVDAAILRICFGPDIAGKTSCVSSNTSSIASSAPMPTRNAEDDVFAFAQAVAA